MLELMTTMLIMMITMAYSFGFNTRKYQENPVTSWSVEVIVNKHFRVEELSM